ncbi:MAG TPA: ATP-binding protein [Candidatus Angelobacter sp.]|jgi:hypothetical protein
MDAKLKRSTGNWAVGDKFWDREVERELFEERIDEGAHLLLVAPRRIGKTSLLKESARRLSERYLCLYVDLQKAQSAADAIVELSLAAHPYKPLWDKAKGIFQNVLRENVESIKIQELGITLRSGLTSGDWASKGDKLFEILASYEKPVVLLFDELPILVNRLLKGPDYQITPERRQTADEFLSWLRANAIRHQGVIRIVIAGSIGLEPVARQAGLSATLNNLTPFHLGPWDPAIAADCLRALANEYSLKIDESAIEEMISLLGVCIPHHIQMFFDYVYQAARLQRTDHVSRELVGEVYNRSMLGTRGHMELSHLEERLRMVLGPKVDLLALDLLTETAVMGTLGADVATSLAREHFNADWEPNLREVLSILEHDGYLESRSGSYVFVSRLLKDWWNARFGFTYVPLSKRK